MLLDKTQDTVYTHSSHLKVNIIYKIYLLTMIKELMYSKLFTTNCQRSYQPFFKIIKIQA